MRAAAVIASLLYFGCIANGHAESSFSWHGFIAQGVNQSIDSDFIADDDEISFDLT